MEKDVSGETKGFYKKESLKKQLSFDENVTEIRLMGLKNANKVEEEVEEEKTSIKWWNPSEENVFANFCKSTSIHGLQYVGTDGVHFGERVLWAIVFIISAVASVFFIMQIFDKYVDSPVIVTFQSSEMFIGEVPFPAVTLCNMNRVLKSKAKRYMKLASEPNDDDPEVQRARRDVYYMDHVCSVSNKPFSKIFNYSTSRGTVDPDLLAKVQMSKDDEDVEDVVHFLRKASQSCSNMIQLCMFEGDAMSCKDVFRPIETNFGKCCTFNMVPQSILNIFTNDSRDSAALLKRWKISEDTKIEDFFGSKLSFPRHQNRAGKASGLMILTDPALDEYFCTSSDSAGFRLSVHFSTDIPHVTDFGLAIRPNYEHFISVTPNVIRADDVIRSYAIEKRKCYFEGEFKLKYYTFYSASNCLDECVANITYEKCICVRYYMPRDDSRDICSPANFSCAENVRKSLFKSGVKDLCQMCLPTCTEIKYSATSTMAPLQRVDLWVDENNNSTPWAKKNVSIINVYFGEDSTYPKLRGQLYGLTDLISQTGGLLGLCMGFSLLSLFEIIYHITCRPWYQKKEKKVHPPRQVEAPPRSMNGNGIKHNGLFDDVIVEARRVHMKPGDDGLYHLQNSRNTTPTPPNTPLYAESVIPELKEEEEKAESEMDENEKFESSGKNNGGFRAEEVEDSHL